MAFKHELGITKPQYFCIEFVANMAESKLLWDRIVECLVKSVGTTREYRDDLYRDYVNCIKKADEFRFKLIVNYELGLKEFLVMGGFALEMQDRFATPTDSRDRWIDDVLRKFEWYRKLGL